MVILLGYQRVVCSKTLAQGTRWSNVLNVRGRPCSFSHAHLTFGFAFENGYVDLIHLVKFFQYGEIHFSKK